MKIDPYAIISLGAAEHQTSVASGTSPTWKDESMEFPVEVPDSEELQLVLKVGIEVTLCHCIQHFLYILATSRIKTAWTRTTSWARPAWTLTWPHGAAPRSTRGSAWRAWSRGRSGSSSTGCRSRTRRATSGKETR